MKEEMPCWIQNACMSLSQCGDGWARTLPMIVIIT
jgi:hypothetical protein